jgi:aldehyde dehydrogenase (NAD(P)+)
MEEGVTEADLPDVVASFYQQDDPDGTVALVLGAGNIASIAIMDTMYALFNEGKVAILKMNPVNDYLGEIFEDVFSELVDEGFVRFAYGGVDVGSYITAHDDIDTIHVTGSASTYNEIVYGTGEEGIANRLSDTRVTTKPIGAELGGVTPMIIVPGKWSKRDLRYQAEHILAAKMHNSGFNCVAAQVLVMPDDWEQKDALLDAVRIVLAEYTGRDPYYPGSRERCEAAIAQSESVETFGLSDPRYLVTGLDAQSKDEPWFTNEIFGPVLTVTTLPSLDVPSYLEAAVQFANETLYGTLNATIVIDPATQREHSAALAEAIGDLEYGTVTVNLWSGAAYFISRCSWGAYPGHGPQDIQSGTGVVHNSLMLDRTEKSVVRGPFAPSPRTFAKGEFHIGPKQIYFPTNKTAHKTGELLIEYSDRPTKVNLAKVAISAVLG